ncbi:hypothetical protein M407DRAFT_181294 [Tulasnella calospora MUT 4182]|uniref:Arrestin C-terminal-like domain-containing protein n=1 Tax=Tulasnella calospora MUT 4182 TaxID=1051891 RepID=A0A0C3M4A0_9AGAM|nr:hypothetical protein M407DRAFT_181294 [Tulasnella calospora MUT 4182]
MPSSISASAALNPIEQGGVSGDPLIAPSPAQSGTNVNASQPNSVMTNSLPLPAVHFALPPHSPSPFNTQALSHPQDAPLAAPPSTLPPPPPFDDLNAELTSTPSQSAPSSVPSTPAPSEMFLFDTSPEHVEIVIPSDNIILRGVGQDVEPTLFAGQIVLRLSEATNIKEIQLNFSGKSKLPSADSRTPAFRQPIATQTFFSHDWSLLEGAKGHRHTLKAGTHSFPFQLNIDDSFPSSVSIGSTSSISYKLRATVVRSSFSSNWVAQRPVTVIRGFSPEALEYNQTLEIENTWPQKIMYSVMIPHKAFAAGDDIPVSLKFTPLVKGVAVMSIETSIKQYLSLKARGTSPFQDARVVAKTTHFIRNGQPVEARAGRRSSPTLWDVSTAYVQTTAIMTAAMQVEPDHLPRDLSPASSSGRGSSDVAVDDDDPERGDNELDTCVKFRIPVWTTPSNLTEPITVNYKLKWSITLSNTDGHTSELRCALPLHILSHTLLDEARAASMQTRAILFGGEDVEPTQTILPSYAAHIQDRIANALDAVAPSRLAPNPLHNLDGLLASAGAGPSSSAYHRGRAPASHSASATPSAGPSTPGEEVPQPELMDTGLLLSLGESGGAAFLRNTAPAMGSPLSRSETTPPDSRRSSFRTGSRVGGGSSRTSSRATSPEPPESAELPAVSSSVGSNGASGGGSKSFFSLKPFTNLANKIASANSKSMSQIHNPASSASGSASSAQPASNPTSPKLLSRALGTRSRPPSNSNLRAEFAAGNPPASQQPPANQLEMLSDLLSRVPDYERATQGFLGGGVPPLDTYAGLPTYNEVESVSRVRSDGALLQAGRSESGHVYDYDRGDVDASRLPGNRNSTPRPQPVVRAAAGEARRRQASFTLDP